jgi:hypothetical protein
LVSFAFAAAPKLEIATSIVSFIGLMAWNFLRISLFEF